MSVQHGGKVQETQVDEQSHVQHNREWRGLCRTGEPMSHLNGAGVGGIEPVSCLGSTHARTLTLVNAFLIFQEIPENYIIQEKIPES